MSPLKQFAINIKFNDKTFSVKNPNIISEIIELNKKKKNSNEILDEYNAKMYKGSV